MQKQNTYRILVLDGQGGGIGGRLVRLLSERIPEGCALMCVGTNALATSTMLKAGAKQGATGENAVIYNAGRADPWGGQPSDGGRGLRGGGGQDLDPIRKLRGADRRNG